jgi:hypothetical protein
VQAAREPKQSLYPFDITYLTVRKCFNTSCRIARYELKAAFVSRMILSNNKGIVLEGRTRVPLRNSNLAISKLNRTRSISLCVDFSSKRSLITRERCVISKIIRENWKILPRNASDHSYFNASGCIRHGVTYLDLIDLGNRRSKGTILRSSKTSLELSDLTNAIMTVPRT